MKIAITCWNDRVSPVFDVSGQVMLFNSEGVLSYSMKLLVFPNLCATEKIASLVEARTNVLICGAISRDAHMTAISTGIKVYPFISGGVQEILQACLMGRLGDAVFAMPGCACRMTCSGSCTKAEEEGGYLVQLSFQTGNRNKEV
jgi:predicted Fe-Mo cluster-binding NifX family protein